jgi:hypothetical protein
MTRASFQADDSSSESDSARGVVLDNRRSQLQDSVRIQFVVYAFDSGNPKAPLLQHVIDAVEKEIHRAA